MKLHSLSLQDKDLFDRYLSLQAHELAVYAFANIYIWKDLFEIRWAVEGDALCVFFRDAFGMFLYMPPLAARQNRDVVESAFAVMDAANVNRGFSRIENVEEHSRDFFAEEGYACAVKAHDYICLRSELAELRGNKYKSKRSSCNYASGHYGCAYRPYEQVDAPACRALYEEWMHERMSRSDDPLYQGMLRDSLNCLNVVLRDGRDAGIAGRVALVDGAIRSCTFGFQINASTWCILYEFADLGVKGLAQFIFREFCREMSAYRYVNVMDDSGLDNLRRVKMSYHPARCAPSYTVRRSG